jgi:hypothetical protein
MEDKIHPLVGQSFKVEWWIRIPLGPPIYYRDFFRIIRSISSTHNNRRVI